MGSEWGEAIASAEKPTRKAKLDVGRNAIRKGECWGEFMAGDRT
jgi:hypothetical protein